MVTLQVSPHLQDNNAARRALKNFRSHETKLYCSVNQVKYAGYESQMPQSL